MENESTAFRLLDGERIIWSGRPAQGLRLSSRDGQMVPFGLAWLAFAVFWEWQVRSAPHAPAFMWLLGVPFILVGIYLVVGRFLLDAWVRSGTRYAVTNRRILISRVRPFQTFIALGLDRLPESSVNDESDRRGTIRFGLPSPGLLFRFGVQPQYVGPGNGLLAFTPALDPTPQFLGIKDARTVFDLIQRASRSAGST